MVILSETNNTDISLNNLCEILSISVATAKNWIKLGKIKPSYTKNSIYYFSNDYMNSIVAGIKSSSSNILKSRRNKKFISGSFFYKDYVSQSSANKEPISNLLNYVCENKINFSQNQIKYILADCAIKLFLKSGKSDVSLEKYLNKGFSQGKYNKLIDDFIDNKDDALLFINKYPYIFETNYIFEKNEDILGLLYISLSNLGNRKAKGAYYTPTKIVKKVIKTLDFSKRKDKKIIDPSCGTGNFLLQLPDNIDIKSIFGNDIDKIAINITRINMALKFQISDINILYKNFTCKDFLIEEFNNDFDYIIGNPPWGAEFPKSTIEILKKKFISTDNKNIESYVVFVEKSLKCLNKNGYLSFVLPEAILNVKTHQTIRNLIMQNNSITYLEFLGNIFDKVQCPSIIMQLRRTNSPMTSIGAKIVNKNKNFIIKNERKLTSEAFNFSMTDEEYEIYKKIFSLENKIFLNGNAIFALGIVTGDNKKYLTNEKTISNEVVIKGSDIEKFKIKIPKRYIEFNPTNFQQVAPTNYYRAKEKLFYRFINKNLVFAYDNNQTLSLNSCNILIPQVEGLDIKYIMAILNSRVAQFVFEKKYNSVKVLRSHIENIPIPVCDTTTQNEIIKLVDEIIENKGNFSDIYERLEIKIRQLYKLDNETN